MSKANITNADMLEGGWNYRLFHTVLPGGSDYYFVAEAYYGKNHTVSGWAEVHTVSGDDVDEAKNVYAMIGEAFDAPVHELTTKEWIDALDE